MRLNEIVECAECLEVDVPSKHGRCSTCNSPAVRWVVGQCVVAVLEPQETPLCGCDKEFLREMGVQV